jgi:hypothetical protein
MLDPGAVMNQVDEGADRLEKAADVYSAAVEKFEELENEVELLLAAYRVEEDADFYKKNGKYPSQDRRSDKALLMLDENNEQLRVDYAAAKAKKEAQATRFRALTAATTARQSLLKALQGS